jgi:hypothetical protein
MSTKMWRDERDNNRRVSSTSNVVQRAFGGFKRRQSVAFGPDAVISRHARAPVNWVLAKRSDACRATRWSFAAVRSFVM